MNLRAIRPALAATTATLCLMAVAAAQCYNPCVQYKGTPQFQSCCQENSSTPACEGKSCPAPPPTCSQQYEGVAEPTLGQDMQTCCTANPSNCGPVNPDYSVFPNLPACGACAPPTMGNYAYGKFQPYTGWTAKTIEVYIDPALDAYTFPNGSTSAGTVQDIENALNATSEQLGFTLTFSSAPLPASTGYTVRLGDGSHGDLCPHGADLECTEDYPRPATDYASTWVDFANWGSPGSQAVLAQDVEQIARHEFGHSNGLADDFATSPASCAGKTAMWIFPELDGLQPGPYPVVDDCAIANKGASPGGGGGGGGGTGGTGSNGCTAPIPNGTCSCVENASVWAWQCQCPGLPTLCPGGGNAVCASGKWVCGSSSSSVGPFCAGTPPDCGPFGAQAVCEASPSDPSSNAGVFACAGGACSGDIAFPGCAVAETCNTAHGYLECSG